VQLHPDDLEPPTVSGRDYRAILRAILHDLDTSKVERLRLASSLLDMAERAGMRDAL
jgi:hypothetical protein